MSVAKTASKSPELTSRSVIVGLITAVIIGSAYPYCVLKLGFGPNLSVVSAFLGFIVLVLILRATGRTPARTTSSRPWARARARQHSWPCCWPRSTC
jgi:high-affinity Fe2+/Pb2+ permease